MVLQFKNPFLSVAGQVERLKNVAGVLSQSLNPFSKEKPVANVNNKVLKAGLEAVAKNPYTAALVVAAPVSSASRTVVASAVSKLPVITKVAAAGAAVFAAPVIISSPKVQATVIKTVSNLTPESIVKAGLQTGKTIESPSLSNIKSLVTENKTLFSAAGIVAAAVVGAKAIPAAASLLSTKATKENTEAILKSSTPSEMIAPTSTVGTTSPTVYTVTDSTLAAPPVVAKTTSVGATTTKKRKRKKSVVPSINNRINVLINNKVSSVGFRAYNKYLNKPLSIKA